MNDITILHLSDLHIDESGTTFSRLLKKLLTDIEKEVSYIEDNSLIVVVTGDILHKAPQYSVSQKAINHALDFFRELHRVLKNKVAYIYIVPGNHDKYRTKENQFLISAYRSMDSEYIGSDIKGVSRKTKFDESFYENFWTFHLDAYKSEKGSGYIEMTREIYKIFNLPESKINANSYITDTFGVDVVEINGKKYCFVLLNTAWSCIDDNDNRNLILGKFQIEEIKKQFRGLMDAYSEKDRPAITIVLGHHPVGALQGKEEDTIFTEMISFESLDANVYLCGHTHDRTVNNWINNRHSLNTFVTGIGWPENQSGQHVGNHTYSMYVFNLNANSIDVYVRSTNDGGSFSPDFRIYTNEIAADSKKLVFPIKGQEAQTYIPLSVGGDRSAKAYYISDEFMKYIKKYTKKIAHIRVIAEKLMERDKNSIYDSIEFETDEMAGDLDENLYNYLFAFSSTELTEETIEKVVSLFKQNKELLFNMFLGFLMQLCQKMQEILIEDDASKDDIVRFHFRYLADKNSYKYSSLCTSFPKEINPDNYGVSEMEYGELIEESYKTGKSLIYTVNKKFAKKELKEKWKNFITVVPLFEQNNYVKKRVGSSTKFPYITFGVTTNNEKFDELLYCMDYFDIKETLEEVIEDYMQFFYIDINQFCRWVKKSLERGDN